jgi:hypothetical protein
MRRILAILLLAVFAAWGAINVKLYLKDGGYHLVREYEVQADRVRYYSVERSQWEEIPLDLVDLKRTQAEAAARAEKLDKDAKSLTEEAEARKALLKEVLRIPQNPGVYWLDGSETRTIKAAESTVHTDKGRKILRYLTTVPQMMNGKGTLEIQGAHSLNVFTDPAQEFYLQLSESEGFGIVRLTSSKTGVRVVEDLTFIPATKDVEEQLDPVDIIQLELAPGGLYKIWAKEPLRAGEYAVVQYTPGTMNIQVWDFGIKPK